MPSIILAVQASLLQASVAAFCLLPVWGAAQVLPELPHTSVDTTAVPPTGRTLTVPAGGDFQAALMPPSRAMSLPCRLAPTIPAPSPCPRRRAQAGSPSAPRPLIRNCHRRAHG